MAAEGVAAIAAGARTSSTGCACTSYSGRAEARCMTSAGTAVSKCLLSSPPIICDIIGVAGFAMGTLLTIASCPSRLSSICTTSFISAYLARIYCRRPSAKVSSISFRLFPLLSTVLYHSFSCLYFEPSVVSVTSHCCSWCSMIASLLNPPAFVVLPLLLSLKGGRSSMALKNLFSVMSKSAESFFPQKKADFLAVLSSSKRGSAFSF
mmetsp:Transcript_976/g.1992  ORF Transcript_976/g.1992 Transcript_976/m.1992 type:complete len:208 (+) Transcript_976:977-1600(+)